MVWDLDNTVWAGILAEGDEVTMRPGVRLALEELDRRGILQSVASRNDDAEARERLKLLEVDHFFLYPQISWGAKHESIRRIATELDIGADTILFVDDDPYERAEVTSVLPDVRVQDEDVVALLSRPDVSCSQVTPEGARRRQMYVEDQFRTAAAENFEGPTHEFVRTLASHYTIRRATAADLPRLRELTLRTTQMNATGYVYDLNELETLLSSRHHLIVMDLADRFGDLGTIGVALIEVDGTCWTIKLILSSCRAMSRGAGGVLLGRIIQRAIEQRATLRAEFIRTDRNRLMRATLQMAGFELVRTDGPMNLLELAEHRAALPAPGESGALITGDW